MKNVWLDSPPPSGHLYFLNLFHFKLKKRTPKQINKMNYKQLSAQFGVAIFCFFQNFNLILIVTHNVL